MRKMESVSSERGLTEAHQILCRELNLTENVTSSSWARYIATKRNYSMEGSQKDWLAVAIYDSYCALNSKEQCTEAETPSFSLVQLLNLSGTSIVNFITKSQKWLDMEEHRPEFRRKIDDIAEAYKISSLIFNRYCSVFSDMFRVQIPTQKPRYVFDNPRRLMEFGWIMYCLVKSNYPDLVFDLVNSNHLLLLCCDFICVNYFTASHRSLLNTSFPPFAGYQQELSKGHTKGLNNFSVLKHLCEKYDGATSDVSRILQGMWDTAIQCYFRNKVLRNGSRSGIFENNKVFENNYALVNEKYASYLTKDGYFDERQFLISNLEEDTPKPPQRNGAVTRASLKNMQQMKGAECHAVLRFVPTKTPLTCKTYLPKKEEENIGRIKTASENIMSLQMLVRNGQGAGMSPKLADFLRTCDESFVIDIRQKVDQMITKIKAELPQLVDTHIDENMANCTQSRIQLIKQLYYKVLEDVLFGETVNTGRYKVLLREDVFHKTVFACSAEMVLYSYSLRCWFVQLFESLKIPAFHFYKIIEIIVRRVQHLPRDIVKHLQVMEEQALDSLSWQHDSPLWESIENMDMPTAVDASVPHEMLHGNNVEHQKSNTEQEAKSLPPNTKENGFSKDACKTGNLRFFFRKLYYLAAIRLQDLCEKLKITDKDIRRKMWTCFEHIVINYVDLLRNRHLDQILMCTVYITCRISSVNVEFKDILNAYKLQPQATSNIYRKVLLINDEKFKIPQTDDSASVSQNQENRVDLIRFYNEVFMKHVQNFATKLSSKSDPEFPKLSPLPVVSVISPSPLRRISSQHFVYTACLENGKVPPIDPASLKYCFNRSPAKDLHAINRAVHSQNLKPKLSINGNDVQSDDASPAKRPKVASKLRGLLEERQDQEK